MRITIASLALLISNSCFAQEQVKHIGVFVEPYYRAAANAAGTPQVAVARAFDARLSLNEPTKIKEVEAEIRANPDLITPMTLMVLSIRLYDMGFREVPRRFVWNLTARIHRSGARWGLWATRQSELSTNPPGGAFC